MALRSTKFGSDDYTDRISAQSVAKVVIKLTYASDKAENTVLSPRHSIELLTQLMIVVYLWASH